SETSTNAQASCLAVACASSDSAKLVRPDDAEPQSSTNDPRGNPPPSTASSSATPHCCSSAATFPRNPSIPPPTSPFLNFPKDAAIEAIQCPFLFAFSSPTLPHSPSSVKPYLFAFLHSFSRA